MLLVFLGDWDQGLPKCWGCSGSPSPGRLMVVIRRSLNQMLVGS